MIAVKRAYEAPDQGDGQRILVDRLWPRGLTREAAHVDEWRRDLAPSNDLRKWFGHEPDKWGEFKARYRRELAEAGRDNDLRDLAARAGKVKLTFVYGAKDQERNNAVALREFIEETS